MTDNEIVSAVFEVCPNCHDEGFCVHCAYQRWIDAVGVMGITASQAKIVLESTMASWRQTERNYREIEAAMREQHVDR